MNVGPLLVAVGCSYWLAVELKVARMRATKIERLAYKILALIFGGVVLLIVCVLSNHR